MIHPSIAVLTLFVIAAFAQTTSKSYPGLTSTNINEFQINGQATTLNPNGDNTFRLTSSGPNQGGSIYLKESVALTGPNGFKASFSTVFSFSMPTPGGIGDEDGAGADGLVFVINAVSNTVGSAGGGMGYSGVTNSVGIEFDTYNNGEVSGNHIGIDLNGNINSVQNAHYETRMNSGTIFYAWVEFNGDTKVLEVRISTTSSRPSNAFLTRTVDLVSTLGSSNVYVGFSAATGSGYNVHQIHTWVFTNTYVIISQCGNAILESGEVCDGGPCCKSDCSGYLSSGTVCRAANGPCDVEEVCSGSSQSCPVQGFASSSVTCRPANGDCDVAEQCSGSSASCPTDSFKASSITCRGSNGACDVVEQCTGSSATCPSDSFQSSSVTCRASNGVCDVVEQCTGSSASCPADSFQSSSVTCRASNGPCDIVEQCTGSSATCPTDSFQSSSVTCRNASGDCDVAEQCSGSSASCPTDSFQSSSVTCRASNGDCDVAEQCTGSSATCPSDSFQSSSVTCRASNGPCDILEQCTGSSAACPSDSFQSSAVTCRASNGVCDIVEQCTGSSAACPTDIFQVGTTCRAASGICDVAETCSGSSAACPSNGFASSSVTCRDSIGPCDPVEKCSGFTSTCPADVIGSFETDCIGLNFVIPGQSTSFLNYDVISFDGLVAERGNIEGRVAVKNNINVGDGWSVGFSTGKSTSDQRLAYGVVAGGNVNWLSGEIYPHYEAYPNGYNWTENMFVGGAFTGASYLADRVTGNCSTSNCIATEFDDVQACYGAYQNSFASISDNVAKVIQWSGLTITCSNANSLRYIVSITPAEMSLYTYVVLDGCNANARWIVNVPTTNNVLLTGVSIPAPPEAVVYNIIGSGRTITINGIYVEGSILAPYNTLYQNGGIVKGRVIVGDITKSLNFDKAGCFTPTSNLPSK